MILTAPLGTVFALTSLHPALPQISAHFADVPYAKSLVRGLVTSVNLAQVIGAPIAGFLVERFGTRRVLLSAALLYTADGLAAFFIDQLWLLLANRFVLGLAEVTVSTTVIALIGDRLDSAQRNLWLGRYTCSGAVSAFVSIELAGIVAYYNWRFIFLFYAIGLVILASAAIALKPDDARPKPVRAHVAGVYSFTGVFFLLPLVGLGVVSGAVENTSLLFLPFHLAEIGETLPSRIAQAAVPIAVGAAISSLLYGAVRRHLSVDATFALSFLSAGLILPWMGMTENYAMIALAVTLLGLTIGLLAPNLYAYAAAYGSEEHRARHIGIARGCFFLGNPLAQLLLEPVSKSLGAGMALVALGGTALLMTVWALMQERRNFGVRD
jgi:MFS family permease